MTSGTVYAARDAIDWYSGDNAPEQIITEVHSPHEQAPHDLTQYKTGDRLGITDGVEVTGPNNDKYVKVNHTYDHPYRILLPVGTYWDKNTVYLWIRVKDLKLTANADDVANQDAADAERKKNLLDSIDNQQNGNTKTTSVWVWVGAGVAVVAIGGIIMLASKKKKKVSPPYMANQPPQP